MLNTELPVAPPSTLESSRTARHLPSATAMLERAAAVAGLKRGFVDDERRAATPQVIDCVGLSRENLGDEPYRFGRELQERTAWCGKNGGPYEIEPLHGPCSPALSGLATLQRPSTVPGYSTTGKAPSGLDELLWAEPRRAACLEPNGPTSRLEPPRGVGGSFVGEAGRFDATSSPGALQETASLFT